MFRKLIKNKIKYIFEKSKFIYSNSPNSIKLKLLIKLFYSEVIYFKPKLESAKYQNFSFSKNMIESRDKPNYYLNNYTFDQMDSFSLNVFTWSHFFKKYKLENKSIKYLEIGCFEGRSSVFLLENIKNATCTFVDPFEEYEEMTKSTGQNKYSQIYKNFINNIDNFSVRCEVFKCSSDQYFNEIELNKKFDLIYIDGSHFFEDVYKDAINSFNHLYTGGFIIFDDFFWSWYTNFRENPFFGVCKFLEKEKNNLQILFVGDQLIIKKK